MNKNVISFSTVIMARSVLLRAFSLDLGPRIARCSDFFAR